MTAVDFDTMTAREIVAGLMRGHKPDFKLGYGPGAAVMGAARLKNIEPDSTEYGALMVYAHGFSKGLALAVSLADTGGLGSLDAENYLDVDATAAFREGLIEGLGEDGAMVNPETRGGY